jgi:acyl-CoA reductase-like NAD-dependent aldehyde dehydrogenase
MTRLSDAQVDTIARRLAQRLGLQEPAAAAAGSGAWRPAPGAPPADAPVGGYVAAPMRRLPEAGRERAGDGVFATVDECIEAATIAFLRLSQTSLARRGEIITAIRDTMLREGDGLARLAVEETRLGREEDKKLKNRLVTVKTPGPEILRPETTTGDHGLTLTEWAPFGVIGAITPTTNPTSTVICNAIGMIAAGNSVVFNVHPGAARCSTATVRLINQAARSAGGPDNLVTAVATPTIESATELMHHDRINLLVVTGGPGVVKAAMASGKRAICAGPGNPPVVVDATADIPKAARDIVTGAGFDNNVVCVDEKEVLVVEQVADQLIAELQQAGSYLVDRGDLRRLEGEIFSETRGPRAHAVINKDWVGQNASTILERIGVQRGTSTRLVIAEVDADHPLVWTEQLMPVLPIVRVGDVETAVALAHQAEHGFGHSASMHSTDIDALSLMARVMNTSIFVKNGPIICGLGADGEGYSSFTIASPTGEGMTSPLSFSRRRRCVMVDRFRIV